MLRVSVLRNVPELYVTCVFASVGSIVSVDILRACCTVCVVLQSGRYASVGRDLASSYIYIFLSLSLCPDLMFTL